MGKSWGEEGEEESGLQVRGGQESGHSMEEQESRGGSSHVV